MTKGKNKAFNRRKIRTAEKNRESMPRGKMMGAICRRNYGGNGPVDGSKINHLEVSDD